MKALLFSPLNRLRAQAPARLSLRFDAAAAVALHHRDEVQALRPGVIRILTDTFDVAALAGRMVPALMEDGSVAIFSLAAHVGGDQADALARRIVLRGHRAASPPRYAVTAPLLLALSRGQCAVGDAPAGADTGERQSSTALAAAFHDLIAWGVRHKASDIHFNLRDREPNSEVRYTIAGHYVAPERSRCLSTAMLRDMLAVAWMDVRGGSGAVFDPLREQQGSLQMSIDGALYLLRWASMAAEAGASVCLRILTRDLAVANSGLAQLGYLPAQCAQIERALLSQGGAVVFAGTVGSGKSTSLAALVSGLAAHRKVLTLEDPVEYLIPGAIQNAIVRNLDEVAHDAYAAKLRAVKRSAMSDVLLGEVRDIETGRAFMDLAISGVNLYTTVHAPSAALIPARLASDFIAIPKSFLATPGVLKLLVYQALLPALCPHCSLPVQSLTINGGAHPGGGWRDGAQWRAWLNVLAGLYGERVHITRIRNAEGCDRCRAGNLPELYGYNGRTLAAEVMEPCLDRHPRPDAMACAVGKALQGEIDLRDIECRFHAFETIRRRAAVSDDHRAAS
ncbi:general secretion pathway protein [Pusillimonas sp. TS35]|uniref:ATPase, T2SS/T4P/T4SS family n=1 Tax=Paracandidimonas lactea TaxID=2895524 RepID=UPI00136C8661|nr:ATPase, T2SS/T4P/T4SS family [Paracandidimonas lactea]MYN11918.1 general secretion pathway protein [Pusillimonas sp. TS35]